MAGQPAFLLPDYGSGGKKAGCFFIKWFLIANKKEEICVSLSPLYNETWKDTIRVKNKFSKIFSIAVYTSFALSVGACKSDPGPVAGTERAPGSRLYRAGKYVGFGGFLYKV